MAPAAGSVQRTTISSRDGALSTLTVGLLAVLLGALSVPAAHCSAALAQPITEFSAPAGSLPSGITSGPDGNLWFTEVVGNRIGRILPGSPSTITEFPVPTADSNPAVITTGPDGNLWFTESLGNKIGRILPGSPNTITEFPVPTADSNPGGITTGPDGNLWFTEVAGNNIGRILPGSPNTITEFPLPTADSNPAGITMGPDGNLWFTENVEIQQPGEFVVRVGKIGRILPGSPNTITEFPLPTADSGLNEIVTGPDGNLWFTEDVQTQRGAQPLHVGKIGRILPGSPNTTTEFPLPTAASNPFFITTGPDGNLWFTEDSGNNVGRILPGSPNTITEFPVPTDDSCPEGITTGPDGNLWFAEKCSDKIGRLNPPLCVGECSQEGAVTIAELITMVNIALGNAQPSACPNGIPSGAEVTVALLVQAVNNALNGCAVG